MKFLEQFETFIEDCQFMGGWLQRNDHLTHVSSGLHQDIAEGLATQFSVLHMNYASQNRFPDFYMLTYESARVIVLSMAANRCGLIVPRSFSDLDAAIERLKQIILLNTLELLQAPALYDTSSSSAPDALSSSDPDFNAWDEVLALIRAELTKVMNAGQVEMFLKMRLKDFEVQTLGDARIALTRISGGVPDRNKAKLLFETVNLRISDLS